MTAAVALPPTITSAKPCDASKAIVAARIRSPLAKIICPSAKSHPRRRTNSPASTSTFSADVSAVARHIFLHHDRVCPLRKRRAGKNPDGFAITDAQFPIRAGRLLSNHAQPPAFFARARHDCVTVHCRIIERGQGQPGEIILRCKTIERACEWNCSFVQRTDLLQDPSCALLLR